MPRIEKINKNKFSSPESNAEIEERTLNEANNVIGSGIGCTPKFEPVPEYIAVISFLTPSTSFESTISLSSENSISPTDTTPRGGAAELSNISQYLLKLLIGLFQRCFCFCNRLPITHFLNHHL